MKKFRKLIPALALLLVSAVLMSTASYAWFSMNNQVTATGMEVKTKVSDNLYIKASTLNAHDGVVNDYKKTDSITLDGAPVLLLPVSTTNGVNFFYTNPKDNVKADGSVVDSTAYIPFTDSSAFRSSYEENTAEPYVDFVYELVAIHSEDPDTSLKLTSLVLTYTDTDPVGSDATSEEDAFRVAVFIEKYNGTAYSGVAAGNLKTIQSSTDATYFTPSKAVVSSSAVDTVSNYRSVVSDAVTKSADPQFYQVVVRLWLEGEDNSCNNETYANLGSGKWKLDLEFTLGGDKAPISVMSDAYYTPAP